MAVTSLLVTPAEARHHPRHHKPLTPRAEQPLTPRADQPLRPRGRHRLTTRGPRHVTQNQTQQETQGQQTAPADVPEPRPADAQNPDAAAAEKKKPDPGKQAHPGPPPAELSADTESEPEPPEVAPIPTQKPDTAEPEAQPPAFAPQPTPKPVDAGDTKMLPDPRSADLPDAKMPIEEVACRERLKALGVEFEEHKAESDPEIGCSIPYPIVLKTLGKSVDIAPGTELNCPMAEAVARFAADVIQPTAKAELGFEVKSIGQASAFVCRPRHGTRKLSEHAFGNALDIASFTLANGSEVDVGPAPPPKDARFLDAVREAACGPFKTVLGPGSDADHSRHFHLDLEPRRHGGTFCQ